MDKRLMHYELPRDKVLLDGNMVELRGKVAAVVADSTDAAIVAAIIAAARAEDVTDLYLLDKTFILDAIREKQERENPKPLTIEELRGMDGDPVWVSDRKYPSDSGYCVIRAPKDTFSDYGDQFCIAEIPGCECGWYEFKKYGMDWIAYRHRPEEDPHGK